MLGSMTPTAERAAHVVRVLPRLVTREIALVVHVKFGAFGTASPTASAGMPIEAQNFGAEPCPVGSAIAVHSSIQSAWSTLD